MIAGVAFDLYAGQFLAGDAANILGVKGSVLAMWGQREFIQPTRRKAESEKSGQKKGKKQKSPKGDPLFSARDLFKLRLLQVLPEQLGVPLGGSSVVGEAAKTTPLSIRKSISETEVAEGEWMWAVARAFENGRRLNIYLYASRPNQEWLFDMKVGDPGKPPCFGWEVPLLYLPLTEIFISIYTECKKLLGLTADQR